MSENGYNVPFSRSSGSKTARVLESQIKFEKEPARRAPLGDKVILKLRDLAFGGDALGFEAAIFDYVAPGPIQWTSFSKKLHGVEDKKYFVMSYPMVMKL